MNVILKFSSLALAVSFVAFGAVHAHDMGYQCTEGADYQLLTTDSDEGPVYVTNDGLDADGWKKVHIYQESNGMSGLQRHDDFCYNDGITDFNKDTQIF